MKTTAGACSVPVQEALVEGWSVFEVQKVSRRKAGTKVEKYGTALAVVPRRSVVWHFLHGEHSLQQLAWVNRSCKHCNYCSLQTLPHASSESSLQTLPHASSESSLQTQPHDFATCALWKKGSQIRFAAMTDPSLPALPVESQQNNREPTKKIVLVVEARLGTALFRNESKAVSRSQQADTVI